MDLALYGICFKMRGTMDLLDFVQSNSPVPIDIMQQVMDQMDSVTKEELAFAEKMQKNWKKAVNEKVPLIMGVADDGGYEITCNVPNELLDTVHILTGLENSKIIEEYTADYLKNICGIDASIISVDVEGEEQRRDAVNVRTEPVQGFDIGDLNAEPEGPAFEDVSSFGSIETEMEEMPEPEIMMPVETEAEPEIPVEMEEAESEIPVEMEEAESEVPAEMEDAEPEYIPDEPIFEEDYMDDGDLPYEEEPMAEETPVIEENPVAEADVRQTMAEAVAGVYKEFVSNIRDRNLDDKLGLVIGEA